MFLFSCLVLKGLEMEKSTEFNLVENKTKQKLISLLKVYRREI